MKRTRDTTQHEPKNENAKKHPRIIEELPLVHVWDDAILHGNLNEELINEANSLWKFAGGDRSQARSFWIPKGSTPRCHLEQMASDLMNFHANGQNRDDILGAEFWVQIRESSDKDHGLGLHFDKDEVAFKTWGISSFPSISTATYLTSGGAPLVVFATRGQEGIGSPNSDSDDDSDTKVEANVDEESENKGSEDEDEDEEEEEDEQGMAPQTWIIAPRCGRHVCFDGSLLHGIPADLFSRIYRSDDVDSEKKNENIVENYRRISVLVNLWTDHQPEGVLKLDIKKAKINTKKGKGQGKGLDSSATLGMNYNKCIEFPVHRHKQHHHHHNDLRSNDDDDDDTYQLKEHINGDTFPITISAIRNNLKIGLLHEIYD